MSRQFSILSSISSEGKLIVLDFCETAAYVVVNNSVISMYIAELWPVRIARWQERDVSQQHLESAAFLAILCRVAVSLQRSDNANLTAFLQVFAAQGSSSSERSNWDKVCLRLAVRVLWPVHGNRELADVCAVLCDC